MKKLILLTISVILFNSCEEQEEQLTDELAEENKENSILQNVDTKSTDLSHLFSSDDYIVLSADYNGDGYDDLWGIKVANTRTGYVDVHILDGKSSYSKFLWRRGTSLRIGGNYSFSLGDYNRDRRIDLWCFRMNGAGTKRFEVHILDGGKKFIPWLTHRATPYPEINSPHQHPFVRDYNNDGLLDVFILDTREWPKSYYDILNGRGGFKKYLAKRVPVPIA